MDSRERRKASLSKKPRKHRAATSSSSVNKTSIVVDATKYIEDLKGKIDGLAEELGTSTNFNLPMVNVETLEKGFRINVYSEENCPGLLVSILQAFEELGLDVLDATFSCADNFHLEAVGGEEHGHDNVDAQMVKQAVLQAIKNWSDEKED